MLPTSGVRHGLLTVALALVFVASSAAAEVEVRTFTVTVDGSRAGEYLMTIAGKADGTVTMTAQADVRVKVIVVTAYSYSYHGTEVWKDGRLQRFDSTATENGKNYAVTAVAEGEQLRVKVNGQERMTRPDVWVNTYWRLPDAKFRNQNVPVLGCDYGLDNNCKLEFLGDEQIRIAGQTQKCSHYRIQTAAPHDLWFDGQERLVRQEWVSDGHRTVIELSGVRRGP
jgi:hypothetical protein